MKSVNVFHDQLDDQALPMRFDEGLLQPLDIWKLSIFLFIGKSAILAANLDEQKVSTLHLFIGWRRPKEPRSKNRLADSRPHNTFPIRFLAKWSITRESPFAIWTCLAEVFQLHYLNELFVCVKVNQVQSQYSCEVLTVPT